MSSLNESQVPCGPFCFDDLPTEQAASCYFEYMWRPLLNSTMASIIQRVIALTAKFHRRWRMVPVALLMRGIRPRKRTGYFGLAPIIASKSAVYAAIAELKRLGILVADKFGRFAIDYSKTPADLLEDETIRHNVLTANRRGGLLSTEAGLFSWAKSMMEWLLPQEPVQEDRIAEPTPAKVRAINHLERQEQGLGEWIFSKLYRHSGYSWTNRTYNTSRDKSLSVQRGRNWLMGKLDDLRNSILAEAEQRRSRVTDKREKRGTLADLAKLFELGWTEGQREADEKCVPTRIVANRDLSLLKTQIIQPFRNAGIDPRHFAKWVTLNWGSIGATYFTKSKGYPQEPAFRWLVTCLETYTQAYRQRDSVELGAVIDYNSKAKEASSAKAVNLKLAKASQSMKQRIAQLEEENRILKKTKKRRVLVRDALDLPDWEDDK